MSLFQTLTNPIRAFLALAAEHLTALWYELVPILVGLFVGVAIDLAVTQRCKLSSPSCPPGTVSVQSSTA